MFLIGGAGEGKSTVTNALYEAVIRCLNSKSGENPDEIKVLKLAPTGEQLSTSVETQYSLLYKCQQTKVFSTASLIQTG